MKLIIAVIPPESLQAIEAALERQDVFLLSVSNVMGSGHDPGFKEIYRGREVMVRRPKLRLEMAVDDGQAQNVVESLVRAGCTNGAAQPSDIKVVVLDSEECVRICNGPRRHASVEA